jgi:hypothetical protein
MTLILYIFALIGALWSLSVAVLLIWVAALEWRRGG